MGAPTKPFEDTHTVIINGRGSWFADVETATAVRLTVLDRQIRDLTAERGVVVAELARIRGRRVYAEITANNKRLDAEVPR